MQRNSLWRLLASLLAIALVATACSSDAATETSTGGAEEPAATSVPTEEPAATDVPEPEPETETMSEAEPEPEPEPEPDTSMADAMGPADESMEPIKIGLINQENSPVGSFPEAREGAEAAVAYINAERNGINGHPIELMSCVQATVEEMQACAQELASEDGIVSVSNSINIWTTAFDFYGTMGDTPIVGGLPLFPEDFGSPNARFFTGGSLTVFGSMGLFLGQELQATNVAILEADNPAGKAATDAALIPILDAQGITYTRILVPTPSTDVTPQVAQAAGSEFDAVLVLTSAAECGPVIQASSALGIDPVRMVYTGTCNDSAVIDAVGDLAVGAYMQVGSVPVNGTGAAASEAKLAEASQTEEILDNYSPDTTRGAFANTGVQIAMNIERVYESMSFEDLQDPATVLAAFDSQAWSSHASTELTCGAWPVFPSVCNGDNYFAQLGSDGTFKVDEAFNVMSLIGG